MRKIWVDFHDHISGEWVSAYLGGIGVTSDGSNKVIMVLDKSHLDKRPRILDLIDINLNSFAIWRTHTSPKSPLAKDSPAHVEEEAAADMDAPNSWI